MVETFIRPSFIIAILALLGDHSVFGERAEAEHFQDELTPDVDADRANITASTSGDWNEKARQWLKKQGQMKLEEMANQPKTPCGQTLEGKWRGQAWHGPYKAFGETVWTDLDNEGEVKAGFNKFRATTKHYGWGSMLAREAGKLMNSQRLEGVGIEIDDIIRWDQKEVPVNEGGWGLQLANDRFAKMQSEIANPMEDQGDNPSEPVCIIQRVDQKGQSNKTWGVLYKVGALSGASFYQAAQEQDLEKDGQVEVVEQKGGAGPEAVGKIFKIQWFVSQPSEKNDNGDLVVAEWTKVLEPLRVQPLTEEHRRARTLRLILEKLTGHLTIIKEGMKSALAPKWLRDWSKYCTITCAVRWMNVFYYTWKAQFETKKLMWLSQAQLGWTQGSGGRKDMQKITLDKLDVTTANGGEKLGGLLSRSLWTMMSSMIETLDHSALFRTQLFFYHSIKQMLTGWIARVLGIDDLTLACKWKGILEIMEEHEGYTRKNPFFWKTFTAWCPGWMETLDPNFVTFKAFQWISNNTKSITEAITKSWLAKKTQAALEKVIRKINAAFSGGSQMVLNGVMGTMDTLFINRLTRMGVIDEEERRMMDKRNSPPAYPERTSEEHETGCVAYYTTSWVVKATGKIFGSANLGKILHAAPEGMYKFKKHGGEMRVREGILEEGVLGMRRSETCKKLTIGSNMKRVLGSVANTPANSIRVLAVDKISEVIDLSSSHEPTSANASPMQAKAHAVQESMALQEAAKSSLECGSDASEETELCKKLREKWEKLPEEGIHRQGYSYCLLLLSESDQGWDHHVLCAQTKKDIEGWRSAVQLHRYAYRAEDREEENEFAALLDQELDSTQVTMTELISRNEGNKSDGPIESVLDPALNENSAFEAIDTDGNGKLSKEEFVQFLQGHAAFKPWEEHKEKAEEAWGRIDANNDGSISYAEWEAKAGTLRERLIMAKVREVDKEAQATPMEVTSLIEAWDSNSAEAAAIAAANAKVDAAVAKFAVGHDLVARDAEDVHKSIDIFRQAFLEAHEHVQFLHERSLTSTYHCQSSGSLRYDPGECVQSFEYQQYQKSGKWVTCYGPDSCDLALSQANDVMNSRHFNGRCLYSNCATSIDQASRDMISSSGGCFPSDALLELAQPGNSGMSMLRRIEHIRVGDLVRTGKGSFERIFAVTQWSPHATGESFMRLSVSKPGESRWSAQAELTPNHYVPVGIEGELRRADALSVGDLVRLASGEFGVVHSVVRVRSTGLHNVKTRSGSIVVRAPGGGGDGIVISTATEGGPLPVNLKMALEAPAQVLSLFLPGLVDANGPLTKLVDLYETLPEIASFIPRTQPERSA